MRFRLICIFTFFAVYPLMAQLQLTHLPVYKTIGMVEGLETGSDLLLHYPQHGCVDREGNVYVLHVGDNQILKFNKDHELVARIGRKGMGPGEFMLYEGRINIGYIAVDADQNIYVLENTKYAVQVLDSEGKCLRSFKLTKTAFGIAVDSKKRIIILTKDYGDGDHLIVYNQDGEYQYSFGKTLADGPAAGFQGECNIVLNENDEVFVSYWCWPYIIKYSADHKFDKYLKIPPVNECLKEILDNQLDLKTYQNNIPGKLEVKGRPRLLYKDGFTANSQYVFLPCYKSNVLGFDFEGNLKWHFTFDLDGDRRARSIIAAEQFLYLLEVDRITVLGPLPE